MGNRKIKFRVWNGECMSETFSPWEMKADATGGWIDGLGTSLWYPGCEDHNLVWMQFTGLKDKNGREIYEGDILDTGHRVLFFEGSFCVTKHGTAGTAIGNWLYARDTAHVVGNIYETKAEWTPHE